MEPFAKTHDYPIGVVIPTYNRIDTLLICLKHLEVQTWKDFEVIVVDDGSMDSTAQVMKEYQAQAPFPFRFLTQPNGGPARARNRAIRELNATACLLLGDDIFASPDLVRLHCEHHRSHPETNAAAVGLTRWSAEGQTVTPFMRWLDRDGAQFAYGDLLRGVSPSWEHFYTSNLSLKTDQLRRHPFDERFRWAAMEDIELGYRLAIEKELVMSFLPDAVAEHLHPTSFRQACRRMVGLGASAHLLGEIWPEHRIKSVSPIKLKLRSLLQQAWVLARLTDAADLLTHICVPNPLMERVLSLHSTLGYQQAAQRANSSSLPTP
ncbi:glycosyltransferase family A protein [Tunturiibacter gelidoferens]|uniref:Glycosyltransferase family 2 protein n=1 Tax=Tunturiibacter gelidiferens TaxID=3069689 RepID=A0AAU7Z425_9BACT